jgi:hypothetical protein
MGTAPERRLVPLVFVWFAVFFSGPTVAQDLVKHFWSGALTAGSIRVNVMVDTLCTSIRLVVDDDPQWASPLYSDPGIITDTTGGMVHLGLSGLDPGTQYGYRFEVNGTLDTIGSHTGRFRTPDEGPMDFTFVVGSCNSDGNHPVWQGMASPDPLFFVSTGDLHYGDPSGSDLEAHRNAYMNEVYLKPPMMGLMHRTPIAYVWDDHDFCGDLSSAASVGKASAARAFREHVPHYPLVDDTAVYQAFTIGRVRFILSDMRSEKTESGMMSDGQYAWLKAELLQARDSGLVVCWATSLTWNAIGYPENWGSQPEERTTLSDWMRANAIRDLFILCGDAHMLAIDDGANGDFSTGQDSPYRYPIFQAAAIDRGGSYKGGTFNQGGYFPNPSDRYGQFGEVVVTDDGADVCITFNGWRTDSMSANVSLINTYTFCRTPGIGIDPFGGDPAARGVVHDSVLELIWPDRTGPGEVELMDVAGRMLIERPVLWNSGRAWIPLPPMAQEVVMSRVANGGESVTLRIFMP